MSGVGGAVLLALLTALSADVIALMTWDIRRLHQHAATRRTDLEVDTFADAIEFAEITARLQDPP